MKIRNTLALAALLCVCACRSTPVEITSGLGPRARAEVRVTDALRVLVRNLGPGRLRVRFLGVDRVAIWLDSGGATEVRGRRDRWVELIAGERATRYRVTGTDASGIALTSSN